MYPPVGTAFAQQASRRGTSGPADQSNRRSARPHRCGCGPTLPPRRPANSGTGQPAQSPRRRPRRGARALAPHREQIPPALQSSGCGDATLWRGRIPCPGSTAVFRSGWRSRKSGAQLPASARGRTAHRPACYPVLPLCDASGRPQSLRMSTCLVQPESRSLRPPRGCSPARRWRPSRSQFQFCELRQRRPPAGQHLSRKPEPQTHLLAHPAGLGALHHRTQLQRPATFTILKFVPDVLHVTILGASVVYPNSEAL